MLTRIKCSNFQRAITQDFFFFFFRIFPKVYQVIYSSSPISLSSFKTISRYLAYNFKMPKFSKGRNSRKQFQVFFKVDLVIYLSFLSHCKVLRYLRFEFPNFQRAITQEKNLESFSTVNQIIFLSSPISILSFNKIAQIVFGISCLQDFIAIFLQWGIDQERGITLIRKKKQKKNRSAIFSRGIHIIMKFQKPSMHGSKVMLCTKKTD